MDETWRRIQLAEAMVCDYRREMGEHVVGAACYGSVAHERADAHSDLELIVLTDTSVEAVNVDTVQQGIQVECDVVPTNRLLRAAKIVTIDWGIEADRYRYQWPLAIGQFAAVRRQPWRRRPSDSRTRCSKVGSQDGSGPRRWWRWSSKPGTLLVGEQTRRRQPEGDRDSDPP